MSYICTLKVLVNPVEMRLDAQITADGKPFWNAILTYPGLVAGDPGNPESPIAQFRDLLGDVAAAMARMDEADLDPSDDGVTFDTELGGALRFQRVLLKATGELLDAGREKAEFKGSLRKGDFDKVDAHWTSARLRRRGRGKR